MALTIVEAARAITGGVDTHLESHVAAALDPNGGVLGVESFPTTAAGHRQLWAWLSGFGDVAKVGVEGTGSYGARLARFLAHEGVAVIEVGRPNPAERRRAGKSDPLDAVEAARAALGGRARAVAKGRDGSVEAIRTLMVAKRSARQARTKAVIQMRHLVITAPDDLHRRFTGLTVNALVNGAARLRPSASADVVTTATKASLGSLAQRVQGLDDELADLDARLLVLLNTTAPDLLEVFGVGPDTAAALLIAAGDNPERLHSEAAWARLCGAAPIPASSGKTTGRYRLNPGGDRQANSALWRIAMVRIAHDPRTTAYFNSKLEQGRSKREVIRTLKRYIARELYPYLPRG
jgi:transposase